MQHFVLTFTEDLLGSQPRNTEVYATWVAVKEAEATRKKEVNNRTADEEPPAVTEERSWTGFAQDDSGLFLWDYQVKGFLKESAAIQPAALEVRTKRSGDPLGEATIRKRLDNWLFVLPRRLYVTRDGQTLTQPDGVYERPLRARTMQGDRIALARSDVVRAGVQVKGQIRLLPGCPITEEALRTWLDYGALKGLGQFRNGGFGRFSYMLEA